MRTQHTACVRMIEMRGKDVRMTGGGEGGKGACANIFVECNNDMDSAM